MARLKLDVLSINVKGDEYPWKSGTHFRLICGERGRHFYEAMHMFGRYAHIVCFMRADTTFLISMGVSEMCDWAL